MAVGKRNVSQELSGISFTVLLVTEISRRSRITEPCVLLIRVEPRIVAPDRCFSWFNWPGSGRNLGSPTQDISVCEAWGCDTLGVEEQLWRERCVFG